MVIRKRGIFFLLWLVFPGILAGCAGNRSSERIAQLQQQSRARAEVETLNRDLALALASQSATSNTPQTAFDYQVGPGDILDVAVFQVEELNRKVRVNGTGQIMIPLLGTVYVQGKTTTEVEELLKKQLGEKYLQNPQVSVFVEEYRSQQVSVLGAVKEPGIYEIRKPLTLIEMLSKAGGLNPAEGKPGSKVYVRTVTKDPETNILVPQNLVIDLRTLLSTADPRLNVVLRGGDSIHVPKAGFVFVEGAVKKPGAYPIYGEANVLKVITMAGGTLFEATEGAIEIFREDANGQQVIKVDLKGVRDRRAEDAQLQDGDIVLVRSNAFKKGAATVWRGFSGIFSIGFGYRGSL